MEEEEMADDPLMDGDDEIILEDVSTGGSPSGSTPANLQISRTRRFTNTVHQRFIYENGYSKCKICSNRLKGKHPTNLKNHLTKHPQEYKKYLDEAKFISEVFPMLFDLEAKLRQMQQNLTSVTITHVVRRLSHELDRRFKSVQSPWDPKFDPIYVLATLLDPRYAELLDGELLETAKRELKLLNNATRLGAHSEGHDSRCTDSRLPHNDMGLFAAVRAKITEKRQSAASDLVDPIDHELVMYFNDLKALDSDKPLEDPFSFWIERAGRFPQMYRLSVDVLSIPATTAPVERIFSRASFILSKKRHNLDDKKLESELFFKVNKELIM